MESRSSFLGTFWLGLWAALLPSPSGDLTKVSRSVWTHTLRKVLGGWSSSVDTLASRSSPRSRHMLQAWSLRIFLMVPSNFDTATAFSPRTWKTLSWNSFCGEQGQRNPQLDTEEQKPNGS